MLPPQITQDTLIRTLVLLRATHPQLPAMTWEISDFPTVAGLRGHSYGPDAVDAMLAYAEALGGDIVPKHTFETAHHRMQSLYLETVFADVKVELRGAVEAPVFSDLTVAAA